MKDLAQNPFRPSKVVFGPEKEAGTMIDWDKTLDEIFADKLSCQRCGVLVEEILVGYTRNPAAAAFAQRCRDCDKDKQAECDARKLVAVCEPCARELRVNARRVDEEGMMGMLLNECRRELEESLDFLAEYWREDLEVEFDDLNKPLEEIDPETFADEDTWRKRLEEEDLSLHRWFRQRNKRIPDPGWRAEYSEEIIGLGYTTLLGD